MEPLRYPILMALAVLVVFAYRHFATRAIQKKTSDYRAGAVARRLGFWLERGQPTQNLFFTGKGHLERQAVDVLLRGERLGVPLELVYFREVTHAPHVLSTTITETWDVRLTAQTRADFGRFELTLRKPQAWAQVRSSFEHPLPEVPTGHPSVDADLRLTTDDPALASALGPVVAPLRELAYVHVVGRPGAVSFLMSHGAHEGNQTAGVGHALHAAERIVDILTKVVLAVEERAAADPGRGPGEREARVDEATRGRP